MNGDQHAMRESLPTDAAYDTSVADRVARLNVVLKRQLGNYAREHFDLTIIETRLILLLAMFGPTTVNTLASRSDIDRTQISRASRELARRKLITKAAGHEDRREAVISLTRSGSAAHKKLLKVLYERNQALIAGVPRASLDIFFEIMELLISRAREQPDAQPARPVL